MTDNPMENISDEFTKTSKIGPPSMKSLNADFFQSPAKIIKSFVLSRNSSS